MAGTYLGAEKSAAKKAGLSLRQWRAIRRRGLKKCYLCKWWKPPSAFGIDKSRSDGVTACCKACTRFKHIMYRYRLTLPEAMSVRSGRLRCQICQRMRKLEVDHDHVTGEVRGLLCSRCNGALGGFLDSVEMLNKAVLYLENHNG